MRDDRFKVGEPFSAMPRSLVSSKAFTTLDPRAGWLLMRMMTLFDGSNNGSIPMTITEAMVILGSGNKTAIEMLQQLRERGVVIRTHKAQRTATGKRSDVSTYMLTMYPFTLDGKAQEPRRDFLRWPTGTTSEEWIPSLEAGCRFDRPKRIGSRETIKAEPVDEVLVDETAPEPIGVDELEGIAF